MTPIYPNERIRLENGDNEKDLALLCIGRKLAVVLNRFKGIRVAVKTDMTDLGRRNKTHNAIDHTETGAQNRNNRELFTGNHLGLRTADRSFDLHSLQREITGNFISHQSRNLAEKLPEFLRAGFFVPHQRHLMLNQRVIHHMNLRHVAIPPLYGSRSPHGSVFFIISF